MPVLKMILAQCILGTVGIFVKQISYTPVMIALVRGFVGALVLSLFVLCRKKTILPKNLDKKDKLLLLLSGLAMAANWIFCFTAYRYADVSLVSVLLYFYPVFIILASPIAFRERLTVGSILCAAICVLGVLLSSGILGGGIHAANRMGVLCALLSAVFAAILIILVKHLLHIEAASLTAMQLMILAIATLLYAGATGEFQTVFFDGKSLGFLVIIGIVHTGIAYSMQFSAVGELSSQTYAVLSYLDPVIAILAATILLGERMSPLQVTGAAMILLAQYVWQRQKRAGESI